ncbi:UNVERIFIED_CONTAM: UDP-glycosyltransferase 1 [Sesamum indicum]
MGTKNAELIFVPSPGLSHLVSTVEMAKLLLDRDGRLSITLHEKHLLRFAFTVHKPPNSRRYLFVQNVAGLVLDMFCTKLIEVADELNLPAYAFFTSGAAALGLAYHLVSLVFEQNEDLTKYKSSDVESYAIESLLADSKNSLSCWPILKSISYQSIMKISTQQDTYTLHPSPESASFVPEHSLSPPYLVERFRLLCPSSSGAHFFFRGRAVSEWRDAMDVELQAPESNNTWRLSVLPSGKRAIGCKWVFKTKLRADGTVERYMARLVAKGFNQIEGIDYTDSFSPVAKSVTVRIFLAIATAHAWPIQQLDINNAFLHGYLEEDIYMLPPEGYEQSSSGLMALLVYVDDILITGPSLDDIAQVKSYLHQLFTIKDLGDARYFLGLEIARGSSSLYIAQTKYILDIVKDTDWASCLDSRRSLTGYCIFLGDALVSWKTKKQSTISRSTAEFEYRSLASTVCELRWVSYILSNFDIPVTLPIDLFCDNKAALHILANPQLADVFTKSIPLKPFLSLISKLGLVSFDPSPTCGGAIGVHHPQHSELQQQQTVKQGQQLEQGQQLDIEEEDIGLLDKGSFEEAHVKEIALALEHSSSRFLWSLRKPGQKGVMQLLTEYEDFNEMLPEGFLERTEGVGKVIEWSPQVALLSHQAVAGFVSHCGWNSTLESVCFGVPMATFPPYAEQQLNAFQLVKELGMAEAIRIDYKKDFRGENPPEIVWAEGIEAAIRGLMAAESGSGVRQKVKEMKNKSRMTLMEGGSSYNAQNVFIEDVIRNIA